MVNSHVIRVREELAVMEVIWRDGESKKRAKSRSHIKHKGAETWLHGTEISENTSVHISYKQN